ncbi:cytochrome P450 [Plectosphaerella cucumerina]|uniref:Cytochrome P450 n=1 Tax=Plectosphaerella cucumerina TaxID=40658 RepID=A0A8K0T3L3_9PEZI|nr:cytochrome P450 [Plectosphaerella cucumerina]
MTGDLLGVLLPLRMPQIAALGALAWVTKCVWSHATSPLKRYPGPYLAGWTNLWRFYHVLPLDSHLVVEALHDKYEPVDPSLVKTISKYQDDWVKTEFYHGGSTRSWSGKVTYNIFGLSDRQDHANVKKPIGMLYSPANALAIEGHVDKAISRFWEELEARFIDGSNADTSCALEEWFLYCNQQFGYMKHGRDFDGTLTDSEMTMSYLSRHPRKLPYLGAIIRECIRLHPAVEMPLERYVPEGGLRLPDGSLVPAGSMVGINSYLVNRTAVFGEDPDVFRPERWLRGSGEGPGEYQSRLTAMHNADLTFGAGSRICSGRHIANLELYKLIATLVIRYEVGLVDPKKTWEVKHGGFLRQSGVNVRLQRR